MISMVTTKQRFSMQALSAMIDKAEYAEASDAAYRAIKALSDEGKVAQAAANTIMFAKSFGERWKYLKAQNMQPDADVMLKLTAEYTTKLIPLFDKALPNLAMNLIIVLAEVAAENKNFDKAHKILLDAAKGYEVRGLTELVNDLALFDRRISEIEKCTELPNAARR